MDVSASIQWLADRSGSITEPIKRKPRPSPPKRTGTSAALREYVHACRAELYKPSGAKARQWLERRCLDPAVLELNDVGFDPGPSKLRRARGLPYRGPGIVLPSFDRLGQLVYAQVRYFDPKTAGRKYDNPSGRHATKPAVSWPRLPEHNDPETIVCEGVIDALTFAGIGLRAAAIISAGDARAAASELSTGAGRLALAFDPDNSGDAAGRILVEKLRAIGRNSVRLMQLPADVNDTAVSLGHNFDAAVRAAARRPLSASREMPNR